MYGAKLLAADQIVCAVPSAPATAVIFSPIFWKNPGWLTSFCPLIIFN
jgi:hypothetical protein